TSGRAEHSATNRTNQDEPQITQMPRMDWPPKITKLFRIHPHLYPLPSRERLKRRLALVENSPLPLRERMKVRGLASDFCLLTPFLCAFCVLLRLWKVRNRATLRTDLPNSDRPGPPIRVIREIRGQNLHF